MKKFSSTLRKPEQIQNNIPDLIHINFAAPAIVAVYYMLSSQIPVGHYGGNTWNLVAILLLTFAAATLNDIYKPTNASVSAGKKSFIKKNQVLLVRSVAISLLTGIAVVFIYLKNLWMFAGLMGMSAAAYIYLFNFTWKNGDYQVAQSFSAAALMAAAGFGPNLTAEHSQITTEPVIACTMGLLVIWQNGLIKSTWSNKGKATSHAQGLFRMITALLIVLCVGGCYLTEYRFCQRLFVILLISGVAQEFCLLNARIFKAKPYLEVVVRILPLLPVTIL